MPESVREGVERMRQGEIDKRKKVWEEKEAQAEREGRFTKKMLKEREREAKGKKRNLFLFPTNHAPIAAVKAAEAAARHREAEEKAVNMARAKADKIAAEQAAKEAERLAAEKAKLRKKPIRYPTEDLDVRITERDKRAGMKIQRPLPSTRPERVPFNETRGAFEKFVTTWNFMICFGSVDSPSSWF